MKRLSLLFFLLVNCALCAQNTEITTGYIQTNFFDPDRDEHYNLSNYSNRGGFGLGLAIENVMIDSVRVRFTLSYSKYGGKISNYNGGKGSGTITRVNMNKSIVSLGFFPLNFRILNRIDLNFGFEGSILLHERFSGTSSKWNIIGGGGTQNLNEEERFNAISYTGVCGRLAYDFKWSEQITISPQYSFHLGLTREFKDHIKGTKSRRQFFGLGIQWAWK
ncbi:MAG: hypothetical protein MI974_07970 [Chitinophagales bacterium]|nr:hypothetical protein [Chitinophagales bacterium]